MQIRNLWLHGNEALRAQGEFSQAWTLLLSVCGYEKSIVVVCTDTTSFAAIGSSGLSHTNSPNPHIFAGAGCK
jgi:hypothetical protein